MSEYFFNLRDDNGGFFDIEGTPLPDDHVALDYAREVARELMKNRERNTRMWRLDVHRVNGGCIFSLPFASVDETLDHLRPETRRLIERWNAAYLALAEQVHVARATLRESRSLVARSRRKPYLMTENGKRV